MPSQKEIDKIMLIIPVKDGESIERALKKYKRKFDKTGVVRQLRARQQFTKPSVTNIIKMSRAIYKQALIEKEEA